MANVTTPTVSTLPVAGADIIAAPLNGWITNIKSFVEGANIDENNVDYSSADGIVVKQQTQTLTGAKTFSAAITASAGLVSGGNILSDTDSTDDLGSTSKRWANVYTDALGDTGQALAVKATTLSFDAASTIDTSGNNNLTLDAGTATLTLDAATIESDATTLSFDTAATIDTSGNNQLTINTGSANLAITTARAVVSGDLEVAGDDLFMGTNTSGFLLIADGTNFNPVQVTGDVLINSSGATSINSDVIVNADVKSDAAIAQSKLDLAITTSQIAAATLVTESEGIGSNDNDTTLPTSAAVKDYVDTQILTEDTLTELNDTNISSVSSGQILIYDGSDSWDNKSLTGDVLIAADGTTSINSDVIVNADIKSNAAIADSKLATISTSNKVSGSAVQLASTTAIEDSSGLQIKSAIAGTGLSLSSQVLSVDAAQTQITSVGTLSALTVSGLITASGGVSGTTGTFSGDLAVDGDTLFVDVSADKVSINAGTTPQSTLHIQNTGTNAYAIEVDASDGGNLWGVFEDSGGAGQSYLRDASGNPKVVLNSVGDSYFTGGQVGIGTSSAEYPLDVDTAGGTSYVAHFRNTTNTSPYTVFIEEPASATSSLPLLYVGTASRPDFRIDSAGRRIGMGVSPSVDMHSNNSLYLQLPNNVFRWTRSDGSYHSSNVYYNLSDQPTFAANGYGLQQTQNTSTGAYTWGITTASNSSGAGQSATFSTKMYLDSTGLGLGTSSPLTKLHVEDSDIRNRYTSTSTNATSAVSQGLQVHNLSDTDNNFAVSTDFFNSTGFVTGRFGAIFRDAGDRNTDLYWATRANGGALTAHMYLTSAGRLGIGTDSPQSPAKLHVQGADGAVASSSHSGDAHVIIENDGQTFLEMSTGNDDLAGLTFSDPDAATKGGYLYSHQNDYLHLQADGGIRVRIDSDGLKFGTDTASANALDDYEQGTHNPSIGCSTSGSMGLSSGRDTLQYTKIGNWVNVQGYVEISSVSSGVGYVTLSMPFANQNVSEYSGITVGSIIVHATNNPINCDRYALYMQQGSSEVRIYATDGAVLQSDSAENITTAGGGDLYLSISYRTQ